MPPAGMPRPDQATYNSVATFLETELDRAATAKPNPGKLPLLHRLSRTEYENAIRVLLALDALPRRWIIRSCCRPIIRAAASITSRICCSCRPPSWSVIWMPREKSAAWPWADPSLPVMVNSYRLSPEQTQDTRVDALPFGTRGGLGVRTYFPLDGDYVIKFELAGAAREAHQIEISVDGERMQLVDIGNSGGGAAVAAEEDAVLQPKTSRSKCASPSRPDPG